MAPYSLAKFDTSVIKISETQRLIVCGSNVFPGNEEAEPRPGSNFFSLMRNLTMTGYYMSELGFRNLGYVGLIPSL